MSDPIRKVQRGQKLRQGLTAAAWNLLIDNLKGGAELGAEESTGVIDPANTALMVADDDYPAFSVLGYGAPVKSPVDNAFAASQRPMFACDAADPNLPFAITLRDVVNGRAVKVAVSGIVAVVVDVSDAGHTRAQPIAADSDKLESCATGGVPVLWKESGTGDKWAMVSLDFSPAAGGSDPLWTLCDHSVSYVIDITGYNYAVATDFLGSAGHILGWGGVSSGAYLFNALGTLVGTQEDFYVGIVRLASSNPYGGLLTNYKRLWYPQHLNIASSRKHGLQYTAVLDTADEVTAAGAAIPSNSNLYLAYVRSDLAAPTTNILRLSQLSRTPVTTFGGP